MSIESRRLRGESARAIAMLQGAPTALTGWDFTIASATAELAGKVSQPTDA